MALALKLLELGLKVARHHGKLGVQPPELGAWAKDLKQGLLFALEDGETVTAQDLARLERLALLLLGQEPEVGTLLTTYPGTRVLVPPGHLRAHLLWRVRNLEAPKSLHLASTDGTLVVALRAPVEALLQAEVARLRITVGDRVEGVRQYLAAARANMWPPKRLVVEGPGGRWEVQTWQEALAALEERRGVA